MPTMKAERLHEIGGKFVIDVVLRPEPRPHDVLVKVEAGGVVPNLKNVTTHFPEWYPFLPLPSLPAIFGLDTAGTVAAVGTAVSSFKPGDRVYLNREWAAESVVFAARLAAATARRRRYRFYGGEIRPAPENVINRDFRAGPRTGSGSRTLRNSRS